jgi:putative MATE family efflux protein
MRRRILQLAWPVILEMSGIMLVGVATTAMVGSFGAASLSAVGLATMMQLATAMVFAAAGTGAAVIVARETGAGNWQEVRMVTGQALLLGFILGLVLAIAGVLGGELIFIITGAEAEVATLAASLLKIMFVFTPAFLVMSIGNAVLRGIGQTRTAFIITSLSNIISLFLGYLLLFGIWLPNLGPEGIAWGIGLSQLVGGIAVLCVLAIVPRIRLRASDIMRFDSLMITRIVKISLPSGMEQLALQGGRIAFTFMLAGIGAVQFAGHQIATQVESISFLPGFAFSVAAMTLVGQYLGKGTPQRAARYAWLTNKIGCWSMGLMGVIFFIFARPLTSLFIQDPAVIEWGTACVRLAALEQPTLALTYVFGGALRGAGDTKWPMYVTITGVWLVRLPLIYLFIIVWGYDITAAWWITAADFLVRSIFLWRRFATNRWQSITSI